MIDLFALLTVVSAFIVVAASPGPATLAMATVSMSAGRKNGLRFALGLGIGLDFWGIIAGTGLGALLEASAIALTVLKLFGGLYLLWLAYGSFRSAQNPAPLQTRDTMPEAWLKRGLLLNLSNPKAVLAWMATLSLGVSPDNAPLQVVVSTAACAAVGFLIYIGYAVLFSMPRSMNIYARLRRWIEGTASVLFALAGFALIRSALTRQP